MKLDPKLNVQIIKWVMSSKICTRNTAKSRISLKNASKSWTNLTGRRKFATKRWNCWDMKSTSRSKKWITRKNNFIRSNKTFKENWWKTLSTLATSTQSKTNNLLCSNNKSNKRSPLKARFRKQKAVTMRRRLLHCSQATAGEAKENQPQLCPGSQSTKLKWTQVSSQP